MNVANPVPFSKSFGSRTITRRDRADVRPGLIGAWVNQRFRRDICRTKGAKFDHDSFRFFTCYFVVNWPAFRRF
jgi:hypothetical protein